MEWKPKRGLYVSFQSRESRVHNLTGSELTAHDRWNISKGHHSDSAGRPNEIKHFLNKKRNRKQSDEVWICWALGLDQAETAKPAEAWRPVCWVSWPRLGSRSYFATVDCTLGNRRMSSVDVHHSLQIYKKPRAWERGLGNLEPNHTYMGSVTISATVFHRKEVPKVILRSSSQRVRETY